MTCVTRFSKLVHRRCCAVLCSCHFLSIFVRHSCERHCFRRFQWSVADNKFWRSACVLRVKYYVVTCKLYFTCIALVDRAANWLLQQDAKPRKRCSAAQRARAEKADRAGALWCFKEVNYVEKTLSGFSLRLWEVLCVPCASTVFLL